MATNFFVRPGFWVRTKDKVKGALDLRKLVREILLEMRVPLQDDCCPNNNLGGAPVRYNTTTAKLEYFDTSTSTWIAVPPATP